MSNPNNTPHPVQISPQADTQNIEVTTHNLNNHVLADLKSISSPNNMVLKLPDPGALYNRLLTKTMAFTSPWTKDLEIRDTIDSNGEPITRDSTFAWSLEFIEV
ncbi:hypothetical protein M0R45_020186 [Rubus argutus]|uniref:Uncharacterized protein n=1 Tax=Rubus argutus TaxID=59490 RepID=A0AAW1XAW2_RUBAR